MQYDDGKNLKAKMYCTKKFNKCLTKLQVIKRQISPTEYGCHIANLRAATHSTKSLMVGEERIRLVGNFPVWG